MFKQIHIIINPAAGQPDPVLHTINSVLADADIDWTVSVTTPQRDGASLAQAAVDAEVDLVVVYGGDGTVYSVINGLAESGIPVALLHGGTGNALAHELGIPTDLKDAMQLAVTGSQFRSLDLGEVTPIESSGKSGYFVLRANVGLHNVMLEQASRDLKDRFGNLGYLIAGMRALTEGKSESFHLAVDGETFDVEGLSCIVANSAAIGGGVNALFAPDVDPSDGKLDVFVVDSEFESLISMMNSTLNADLSQFPKHWHGEQVEINVDKPASVSLDGETFCETPVSIRVIPDAIQILVPKDN